MPGYIGNGLVLQQYRAQRAQAFILGGLESIAVKPLQFNANRVVVAIATPAIKRRASMPRAMFNADKLPQLSTSRDEEVGRYFQIANGFKVRMRSPVEGVGKKALNLTCIKLPGRQTDCMNND